LSRKWIQVALLIASMGTAGWAHSQLPVERSAQAAPGFVPDPAAVRALALGFDAILADYHWLQAVQVVGGAKSVDHAHAEHLGRLIDVVTTLNPHVDHPYRFASIWLTHDDGQVREGIRLLRRATRYHPEDWRNHFYQGFAHFFYLGEYEQAANALERAMRLPDSPRYLPRLVARMKGQSRDIDVAEIFLREIMNGTEDPDDRARIQIALDEIEIEHKARHLDRAREAFRKAAGRDIRSVSELIRPPYRMLEKLPSPEPDAIPAAYARGSVWKIDRKTNRIVSSYLGRRYEVHYTGSDRARLEARQRASAPGAKPETNGGGSL
jgi:tetratricopeptide (TPR) repeat protein